MTPFNFTHVQNSWVDICPCPYLHILFHNLNFRFTKEFSEIYEFIITGAFLWCLVTICSSLLVLQAEIVKVSYMKSVSWNKIYFISLFFSQTAWNLIDMVSTMFQTFWSFISIFFFCELGEQVTSRFEQFNDELDQCCWYLFPIDLQRMIPTVMANTQDNTIIHGFGNTLCTRLSFNKVYS